MECQITQEVKNAIPSVFERFLLHLFQNHQY